MELDTLTRWLLVNLIDLYIFYSKVDFLIVLHFRVSFGVQCIYIYSCSVLKLLEPVLHDWCSKGRGMYYPVCRMMHIKEPLLLIGKSNLCGGSGFPLSLSEWSFKFTIYLTPYNRI